MLLNGNYYINNLLRPEAIRIIVLIVLIFTLAIPALIFVASRYLGVVDSLEMEAKQERIFAITVLGVSSWFCWRILANYDLPAYYTDFLLLIFTASAFGLIISFFKKFSLHIFGWSVIVVSLAWYIFSWQCFSVLFIALAVALTGVVAWSRLKLNAHTPGEIYLGFALGLLPVVVLLIL
ncbi:MAG TPA: hypothetical protein DHV29_04495 [Bacteroidales bacterium]|nr:MAG: hypothetical protein A2W94_03575 [Bacteroidetes bacterium GWE2_42_42]HCY22728.1 hypothetical protein [Bacteroidales bacterium]